MKIVVTRDHIRDGQPNNEERCPVAAAIRDEFNKPELDVHADLYSIKVNGKSFPTPDRVRRFMDRYDYAQAPSRCRPFAFEIEGLSATVGGRAE